MSSIHISNWSEFLAGLETIDESLLDLEPEDAECDEFKRLLDNYYRFYPDTLMPLLFIALAAHGKVRVSEEMESQPGAYASLDIEEIYPGRPWVKANSKLSRRLKRCLDNGIRFIDVSLELDVETAGAYSYFKEHDEVTVVREYHQRIGVLSDHMRVDRQKRVYALVLLVEFLVSHMDFVKDNFIELYDQVMVASGLQPERPRLDNARLLKRLLQYDGSGNVYSPFAGICLVGAMLGAGSRLYADGDDPRIMIAGQVLNYGAGGNNAHFTKHDSRNWQHGVDFSHVVSTYRGLVNGRPALCFCLEQFMESAGTYGKYAGIIKSSDLFDGRNPEIEKAIEKDLLECIVVLPYNETVLLFNKCKKPKGKIRLYDTMHNVFPYDTMDEILDDRYGCVKTLTSASLVRQRFNLRRHVVSVPEPLEGKELVSIRNFIRGIPQRKYDTSRMENRNKAMLCIDTFTPYDFLDLEWMAGLRKDHFQDLYNPVYKLSSDSLIIKSSGAPEPRLFNVDGGIAFFEGGLAFELLDSTKAGWLVKELRSLYVSRQLHPYGVDHMIPNEITEEQFLSIKLYVDSDAQESVEMEVSSPYLASGYVVHDKDGKRDYTILNDLGQGGCGITYRAMETDLMNGSVREVALKECFVERYCTRDGARVVPEMWFDFAACIEEFLNEAKVMMRLGATSDSHIVPAQSYFRCEDTGTAYYVMENYVNGSLEGFMRSHASIDESFMINNVARPLAKALAVVHGGRMMHLDIKPDNIMMDSNGEAMLTDFGLIKEYDKDGNIISQLSKSGTVAFAAPEQMFSTQGNALVRFAPPTDVYGLAGTLYYLMSRKLPHSIMDFSDQDISIRKGLSMCSKQTQDAIVAGLQHSAVARPSTALAFLSMFPGCEV